MLLGSITNVVTNKKDVKAIPIHKNDYMYMYQLNFTNKNFKKYLKRKTSLS